MDTSCWRFPTKEKLQAKKLSLYSNEGTNKDKATKVLDEEISSHLEEDLYYLVKKHFEPELSEELISILELKKPLSKIEVCQRKEQKIQSQNQVKPLVQNTVKRRNYSNCTNEKPVASNPYANFLQRVEEEAGLKNTLRGDNSNTVNSKPRTTKSPNSIRSALSMQLLYTGPTGSNKQSSQLLSGNCSKGLHPGRYSYFIKPSLKIAQRSHCLAFKD